MPESDIREVRRASSAGFHFINLYQNCPRKWWITYGLGIVPTKLSKALLYGLAWHKALGEFYSGHYQEDILQAGLDELLGSKMQYHKLDDFESDLERMKLMVPIWYSKMAPLIDQYEVLAVEEELHPELSNGMKMTIRPDAILLERPTKQLFIAEHKSTAWSISQMVSTVEQQDQATAYIWGAWKEQSEWAKEPAEVLLDVSYNRGSSRQVELEIIHRTKQDLATFELSMIGLFQELSQKLVTASDPSSEVPNPILFPRNGSNCSMFGCEYESLCRVRLDNDTPLSEDFTRDPWLGATRTTMEALGND